MACTPEEIEAKRRKAMQILQSKRLKFSPNPRSVATPLPSENYTEKNNYLPNHKLNTVASPKFYNLHSQKSAICALISERRFEVKLSIFDQRYIDTVNTIPSRRFNSSNKTWNFHIKDYQLLLTKLSQMSELQVAGLPSFVLNFCNSFKDSGNISPPEIDWEKIEPTLNEMLMSFQRDGVSFAIEHNGRCLIGDDMGLGKTIQSLAVASYYKDDWPLLIITTSSMKNTWEETIAKYMPSIPLLYIQYMSTVKDSINEAKVLITSYDMMGRCVDKLLKRNFKFLILDESHSIKNFKTKCSQAATQLSRNAKRVILLSGTPALSRPSELYSQLATINEQFFGNFFEYSKRYCEGQQGKFGWEASGKANLQELEIILCKKFMIRRTKNDVLQSLPNKKRHVIKLDLKANHLTIEERESFSQLVNNYTSKPAKEKHYALLALFSESARMKIPSVCIYLESVLQSGEKFIIFAHHQVMLNAICHILNKHRKKFIRIDGQCTSTNRKDSIDKFQLQDDYIAAVLSITAANTGITLTAAHLVLFAELHWNPSILCQAESRAHRIGQSDTVSVRYLLASGTVDDHIWPLLLAKQNVLNEVGLCKDSFKDTDVEDQVITRPSAACTSAGTNDITKYFKSIKTESNPPASADETLQQFLEEDDEVFNNIDFDF